MALVERDRSMAFLVDLLAAAVDGRGSIAVIGGTVGSGKTELLHALADRAGEQDIRVLRAAGMRSETAEPLGVLAQLLLELDLPEPAAERTAHLLDEAATHLELADGRPETAALPTRVMHGICGILGELASRQPLLILVDDVHWSDDASQQCLLYLVRRLRTARVLMVFAESEHALRANPLFRTELLRESRCVWVHTAPLSVAGVAHLLGTEPGSRVAAELHGWTGGNPLLVRALLADRCELPADPRAVADRPSCHQDHPREHEPAPGGERPVVRGAFGQAVLSCLHRGEPLMWAVARGAAVLDRPASEVLLARLLGAEPQATARAVRELENTGLFHEGWFRHPGAARAVLEDLCPQERAELHRRAAELLYHEGATATEVARQLLGVGSAEPHRADPDRTDPDRAEPHRADPDWAVPTLREAAEAARLDSDLELCIRCLELACEASADAAVRARIGMALAEAEWRLNPAAAARHLPRLLTALENGHLPARYAHTLIRKLLWHGRVGAASEVLFLVDGKPGPEAAARRRATHLWMRTVHPELAGAVPAAAGPAGRVEPADQGTAVLMTVLTEGGDEHTAADADRVLRETGLDEATFDSLEAALLALVYGDRVQPAGRFCARLADLAAVRRAPFWQARLAAVQAEVSLRQGDARAAERHARFALTQLAPRAWGVAVGAPLATLVLALVATGRLEEAAELLNQPAHDALFETRFGLLFQYARGQYHLASGRPAAALEDFRACGRQMRAWDIDLPTLVPWRGAAAMAHLRVNGQQTARKLMADQLARPGAGGARTYGVSMRQLAAASGVRDRPDLLRKAVKSLQTAGDRLELAHALAELSRAHQALGEAGRAKAMAHHALELAAECHAEPLARTLLRWQADAAPEQPEPPTAAQPAPAAPAGAPAPGDTSVLSEAELRVAELASMGYMNREVAKSLHVTVSTVEQHLTRVYRKLNISGRNDLSGYLGLRGTGPALAGT
ncbi:ATP-binding protein [Kitasatospora sp. NPDC006697]|uniref:ATP-binding protein n=1 Tax=Kitasatospora sp. NPDC006697 TaxID=3364020 RepID=UPI00368FB13A